MVATLISSYKWPFCMQMFNCMDVFGHMRSPNWTGILKMWTNNGDVELNERVRVRASIELSIE